MEHLGDSNDHCSIGMRRNELTVCAFYSASWLLLDVNVARLNHHLHPDRTRADADFAGNMTASRASRLVTNIEI